MKKPTELWLPGILEHIGPDRLPCRIPVAAKSSERREHAGGVPRVTAEFDRDGEIVGYAGSTDPSDFYEEVFRDLDGMDTSSKLDAILVAAAALRELTAYCREDFERKGISLNWKTAKMVKEALIDNYVCKTGLTMEQIGNALGVAKQHVSLVWCEMEERFGFTSATSKTEKAKQASRVAQLARLGRAA